MQYQDYQDQKEEMNKQKFLSSTLQSPYQLHFSLVYYLYIALQMQILTRGQKTI